MQAPAASQVRVSTVSFLAYVEKCGAGVARLLDRYHRVLLILSTLCYAAITVYEANRKLFWFDELFTIHIARLRDPRLMLNALRQGADLNPPLLYIFTALSEAIFGTGHLGARIPAIVGFWVFCLCLFRFVSLRAGALAGFISMGFPLITVVYFYAFETRSYGAVLGFCGLALISWQALTSRADRRFWPAVGLFTSLTLALGAHTYAVLIFAPFLIGEFTRALRDRRIDRVVWSVLGGSGLTVFFSLPLLLSMRAILGPGEFLPPTLTGLLRSYDSFSGAATTLIVITFAVLSADYAVLRTGRTTFPEFSIKPHDSHGFEPHEQAALFGFLAIPVFSYCAALLSGSPMMDRYSLATVVGVACLVGAAASKRVLAGLLILTILVVVIGTRFWSFVGNVSMTEPSSSLPISTSIERFNERYQWMSSEEDRALPIVLLDGLEFAPTFYYAPPDIAPRLVYLRFRGTDVTDVGYQTLQRCCAAPGRIVSYDELRATADTFLAYSPLSDYWRVRGFQDRGGKVSVKTVDGEHGLFRITFPAVHASNEK